MKLRRIALDGFRNYTDFTADFSPGVNVIWGENAQGKTNLLEAIGFLSGARSHRARGDKELISFHRDRGTITAEVTSRGRDFLLEVQLFRGARRRLFVNHVKCKTAAELGGIVQTVLFCPEDLALIKAGAAERRSFLDHAICQLRPRYAEALAQYHKLLDHKTRILRDWEKHPSLLDVLEDFNEAMARAGALVIHYRAHFVRKLAEKAAQIQTEFSGGRETLALHYATVSTVRDPLGPTVELYEDLRRHQDSHAKAERDRCAVAEAGRAGAVSGRHRPVAHPAPGRCALGAGRPAAGFRPAAHHRRPGDPHRLRGSGREFSGGPDPAYHAGKVSKRPGNGEDPRVPRQKRFRFVGTFVIE